MAVNQGVFGDNASFEERFVPNYDRLESMVRDLKSLGVSVVLTSGSFDLVHQGHAAYLEAAKALGGLLIVGVDSDEKIRHRKGPDRPAVPETERVRMLTYLRSVDLITLKVSGEPKWELIKRVRPDVLVATEDTYTDEQILALREFCGRVEVLARMGEESTSARLRTLQLGLAHKLSKRLTENFPRLIQEAIDEETRG